MELVQRVQAFKRNLDTTDDPNLPWYKRKKKLMLGGIIAVILCGVLLLFFGGYFAGLSTKERGNEDEIPYPEPRVILPLEWEGVCPKRASKCPSSFDGTPPLILISLDALHPSFIERGFTPTIKNISKCGSHTPYMFPVFPSKTFPNHFSQVTGVNPVSHGIIDNTMYDPFRRKLFKVGQPESLNPSWWLKDPIWVTAEKYGKKTGCFFWPGSEVAISKVRPTYYKKYNAKIGFDARVDQILAWLDLPRSSRPQFLTLYVNQPDRALHEHGTNAKEVNEVLVRVDRMIERLLSGLQARKLLNCVNIIIISDHGMADTSCSRLINIEKMINVAETFTTVGPFGRIRPKGKKNSTLVAELVSKLSCQNSHMRAYAKENLPVRMHYAESPRVEPIFLDLDAGWTLVSRPVPGDDQGICSGGAHGYDNIFPEMRASFLAYGPSFKSNLTMEPFINTEIYELLAELLDIPPNPNNGTKGSLHYILNSPHKLPPSKVHESPPIADIPNDDNEYDKRVEASGCSCPQSEKQEQVKDILATQVAHIPFGPPHSTDEHSNLRLLYNEEYISAFHLKYKVALWSSFTIQEKAEYKKTEIQCWTGDSRINADSTLKCSDYATLKATQKDVVQSPLFPLGFSKSSNADSSFITNSIAKSLNHTKLIEEAFNEMLQSWSSETGDLNVVIGPAYNLFATELKPKPTELMNFYEKNGPLLLPTHIFIITTWCSVKTDSLKKCDPAKLMTHAFLLHNHPFPRNCEPPIEFIKKNSARVVDIEKLTGLSFFTELKTYDAIRLRTMMPTRFFE